MRKEKPMKKVVVMIVLAITVSVTALPFVTGTPAVYADEGGGEA
jgi:hypothetical protein